MGSTAKLILLKDAPWAFASQRLRNEWFDAQEVSPKAGKYDPETFESLKKKTSEDRIEAFKIASEGVSEVINNLMELWRIRSAPVLAMQESLLQKLREGKLEGVETTPERKRELEMLPSHLFIDAKINWERNTVTNLNRTYSVVQVRRRSTAGVSRREEEAGNAVAYSPKSIPKPGDQSPSEAPRRKPGPASGQKEVFAAYDRMLQRGEIKGGMTIKAICQKMLPDLKRNSTVFPNGRGLTYSSIARHLRSRPGHKFSS
jgi:hypothetical protein